MTHYRLTIATGRAATTFCISAETRADADRKAAAIVQRLNIPRAKIQLTTRDYRVGERLAASFAEPRAPSYWGA